MSTIGVRPVRRYLNSHRTQPTTSIEPRTRKPQDHEPHPASMNDTMTSKVARASRSMPTGSKSMRRLESGVDDSTSV